MLEHIPKLINFSYAKPVVIQQQKSVSENRFYITPQNKFRLEEPFCPKCNKKATHNGYYKNRTKFTKELGLEIKIGQYECKCGYRWSVKYKDIDKFIKQHKHIIQTTVFNLCSSNLSLEKISKHIFLIFGDKISKEWIRQLFFEAASEVRQIRVIKTSGIFHYDEQVLKLNGKKVFRLTIRDAVFKNIILDKKFDNATKETIRGAIKIALLPYKVSFFITDLDLKYPNILKELFPRCKQQFCIFHLDKLILKDFGKKISLIQLHNMYSLFDLFFNHEKELCFLKRQLKKYEKTKTKEYEKKLIKEFYEYRNSLKKNRRRKFGTKLKKRTKQETLELLRKIENLSFLYPKKIKKRIKNIRENLDNFTVFQENSLVPPTNNNVEHYYSNTLQKTAKKRFRSEEWLGAKLDLFRAKANGFRAKNFDFFGFLMLCGKMFMLFS